MILFLFCFYLYGKSILFYIKQTNLGIFLEFLELPSTVQYSTVQVKEWWPRLLSTKDRHHWLRVDFQVNFRLIGGFISTFPNYCCAELEGRRRPGGRERAF